MSLKVHSALFAALVGAAATEAPSVQSFLESRDVIRRQADLIDVTVPAAVSAFERECAEPDEPETDANTASAQPDRQPVPQRGLRHYRLRAETGHYTMTMGNGSGRKGPGPDEPESECGTGQAQAAKPTASAGVTVVSGVGISVSRGGWSLAIAEAPLREGSGPDEPDEEQSTTSAVNTRVAIGPEGAVTQVTGSRSLARSGAPSAVVDPPRKGHPDDVPDEEHSTGSVARQVAGAMGGGTGEVVDASADIQGSASLTTKIENATPLIA